MGLKNALDRGPAPDPRRKCGVRDWLNDLPDDERDAGFSMLDAPRREWSTVALEALFRAEGCPVGRNAIDTHRNGRCACVTQ